MKRFLWSGMALVVCAVATRPTVAVAQGATVCDSPCKLQHLPLIQRNDQPVPSSNPLAELQGRIQGANTPYFEYQVDKPAAHIPGSAWPQYPDSLKAAKIEGEVVAAFIVDTLGVADPNSLRILRSTDPRFSAAVRAALPGMRFTPAEKGGVKVRQLVQEPFVFNLPR